MAKQETLTIAIKANDNASKALKDIEKNLLKLEKFALKKLQSAFRDLSKYSLAALAGIGAAVLKIGSDFEQGMADVRAVTGATGAEFADLREEAKRLGATTKFTATQASEGMKFLGMAGFDTSQILQSIGPTLDLAAAASMDLGQAADIATNVLTGFNLRVDQSQRVVDVLAKSQSAANLNVIEFSEAWKMAGPVAASAGQNFEEMAAIVNLLANAGIKGTMAGTALKNMIVETISPTAIQIDSMNKLGVSVKSADGKMRSLRDILEQVKNSGANTSEIITMFGLRAGPAVAALLGQGIHALDEMKNKLDESGGTAAEQAAIKMDTLKGSFVSLLSAIEGVGITLFEGGFGAGIKSLIDIMTGSTRKLNTEMGNANRIAEITRGTFDFLIRAFAGGVVYGYRVAAAAAAIGRGFLSATDLVQGFVHFFLNAISRISSIATKAGGKIAEWFGLSDASKFLTEISAEYDDFIRILIENEQATMNQQAALSAMEDGFRESADAARDAGDAIRNKVMRAIETNNAAMKSGKKNAGEFAKTLDGSEGVTESAYAAAEALVAAAKKSEALASAFELAVSDMMLKALPLDAAFSAAFGGIRIDEKQILDIKSALSQIQQYIQEPDKLEYVLKNLFSSLNLDPKQIAKLKSQLGELAESAASYGKSMKEAVVGTVFDQGYFDALPKNTDTIMQSLSNLAIEAGAQFGAAMQSIFMSPEKFDGVFKNYRDTTLQFVAAVASFGQSVVQMVFGFKGKAELIGAGAGGLGGAIFGATMGDTIAMQIGNALMLPAAWYSAISVMIKMIAPALGAMLGGLLGKFGKKIFGGGESQAQRIARIQQQITDELIIQERIVNNISATITELDANILRVERNLEKINSRIAEMRDIESGWAGATKKIFGEPKKSLESLGLDLDELLTDARIAVFDTAESFESAIDGIAQYWIDVNDAADRELEDATKRIDDFFQPFIDGAIRGIEDATSHLDEMNRSIDEMANLSSGVRKNISDTTMQLKAKLGEIDQAVFDKGQVGQLIESLMADSRKLAAEIESITGVSLDDVSSKAEKTNQLIEYLNNAVELSSGNTTLQSKVIQDALGILGPVEDNAATYYDLALEGQKQQIHLAEELLAVARQDLMDVEADRALMIGIVEENIAQKLTEMENTIRDWFLGAFPGSDYIAGLQRQRIGAESQLAAFQSARGLTGEKADYMKILGGILEFAGSPEFLEEYVTKSNEKYWQSAISEIDRLRTEIPGMTAEQLYSSTLFGANEEIWSSNELVRALVTAMRGTGVTDLSGKLTSGEFEVLAGMFTENLRLKQPVDFDDAIERIFGYLFPPKPPTPPEQIGHSIQFRTAAKPSQTINAPVNIQIDVHDATDPARVTLAIKNSIQANSQQITNSIRRAILGTV